MAKISVSPIVNSPDISGAVNNAVARIVNELNDKVLYRRSPDGEPNTMSNDLDMGQNDILNVGTLDGSKIEIAGNPLYEVLQNAVYQTIINPESPFVVHNGIERFVTTTVDPDTLHTSGWYYTTGIGAGHPAGNVAGWLLVFARASGGVPLEYTMQVFIPHDSNYKIYVRAKWTAEGSWSIWFDLSSGGALTTHEALTSTAHNIGSQITSAVSPFDGRITAVEDGLDAVEGRVDSAEAELIALDGRVDALECTCYLTSLTTATIPLSTTPAVVMGNIDTNVGGIVRNPDGSITYTKSGRYIVSWTARISVTTATTVHFWLEKWDDVLLEWNEVAYSGIARAFPTTNEVEFAVSYLRVTTAGDTYRIMASKLAAGSASIAPATLPNGVVMPSFRVDIRN